MPDDDVEQAKKLLTEFAVLQKQVDNAAGEAKKQKEELKKTLTSLDEIEDED